MFHAIDDFLIDKVFQKIGDWICNKTGCGVYRQAYIVILADIALIDLYSLLDVFVLHQTEPVVLFMYSFMSMLTYFSYRPRYKRDAEQEDASDLWARTALKGYRVTEFMGRMISLQVVFVDIVCVAIEFSILPYSSTLKWLIGIGTLMIAEYLHACRSHPPRQTRKQTKHLFAGAAQTS